MLIHRILTAIIAIPLAIFLVMRGGTPFALLVSGLAVVAFHELHTAFRAKQIELVKETAYPAILVLVLSACLWPEEVLTCRMFLPVFSLALAGTMVLRLVGGVEGSRLASIADTLFAILYCGMLFSFLGLLRGLRGGTPETFDLGSRLFLTALFATWVTDTCAYSVGKTLGKRKLCEAISPNKTLEGALGAVLGSALITTLAGSIFGFGLGHGLALGLIIGVGGQIGDLCESLIKRDLGIKDFPTFFPGHGGVLDRLDSLLFSVPLVYLYSMVFLVK